jgi:hypothetical protein
LAFHRQTDADPADQFDANPDFLLNADADPDADTGYKNYANPDPQHCFGVPTGNGVFNLPQIGRCLIRTRGLDKTTNSLHCLDKPLSQYILGIQSAT